MDEDLDEDLLVPPADRVPHRPELLTINVNVALQDVMEGSRVRGYKGLYLLKGARKG